jgi:hypothetical protein
MGFLHQAKSVTHPTVNLKRASRNRTVLVFDDNPDLPDLGAFEGGGRNVGENACRARAAPETAISPETKNT